ncbi:DUF397 domain-containing protein [Nocardia macrotermitis]|nr:DUF397 domain-containing protein [Nocardia macrotermitis]
MKTIYTDRRWIKSSYSRETTNCVEVSFGWYKSSFSRDTSNCVEILRDAEAVLIRDSKYQGDPAEQPILSVRTTAWAKFLTAVTLGESITVTTDLPAIEYEASTGETILRADDVALTYTSGEWEAFIAGIRAGEFSPLAA